MPGGRRVYIPPARAGPFPRFVLLSSHMLVMWFFFYLQFILNSVHWRTSMSHSHSVNFKTAFTIEQLADSEIKISGELPYVELESERTAAIVDLGRNVEIDGFRKGNVPQAVLEKRLGEMAILAEMAERAIAHAYPHILDEHNIEAIGHPKIEITKIAPGNPLGFTATVAVVPTFSLPDYSSLAKDVNKNRPNDEVTDTEIEEKINDILRQKAAYERLQSKAQVSEEDAIQTEEDLETKLVIPELTDEIAQSLGQPGQFTGIDDLKTKLREHLEFEKKNENIAKHRAELTDKIVDVTEITLPKILIESEINQMFSQMQEDLDRANLKMDDYLGHIKKTKSELVEEWEPAAIKRAKLQLVLNEIAKAEKLTPDMEKVEEQTKVLMERFKDADQHRVRVYVASVLMNEEVMKKLESF
jgi:trigger factor